MYLARDQEWGGWMAKDHARNQYDVPPPVSPTLPLRTLSREVTAPPIPRKFARIGRRYDGGVKRHRNVGACVRMVFRLVMGFSRGRSGLGAAYYAILSFSPFCLYGGPGIRVRPALWLSGGSSYTTMLSCYIRRYPLHFGRCINGGRHSYSPLYFSFN